MTPLKTANAASPEAGKSEIDHVLHEIEAPRTALSAYPDKGNTLRIHKVFHLNLLNKPSQGLPLVISSEVEINP